METTEGGYASEWNSWIDPNMVYWTTQNIRQTLTIIIVCCYLYLGLILINTMLFPQKDHCHRYTPKSQRWDMTQRAIGYLRQLLQYEFKTIVEWVQSHQSTHENRQQFHHHHRQSHRIAHPVDHQFRRYRRPPKFHPSLQVQALNSVSITTMNPEGDLIHGN